MATGEGSTHGADAQLQDLTMLVLPCIQTTLLAPADLLHEGEPGFSNSYHPPGTHSSVR